MRVNDVAGGTGGLATVVQRQGVTERTNMANDACSNVVKVESIARITDARNP